MATKEQLAFTSFKAGCPGTLNLYRVENQITAGMPDVIAINRSGCVFWLELKAYEDWPKRDSTCIFKGKFEKGQLGFLCSWRSWNGHAFVLLKVGKVYYLIRPSMDLEKFDRLTLMEEALAIGKLEIIEYLEGLQNEN